MKQKGVNELERKQRKEEGPKEEERELLGMNSAKYGDGEEEKKKEEEEEVRRQKAKKEKKECFRD